MTFKKTIFLFSFLFCLLIMGCKDDSSSANGDESRPLVTGLDLSQIDLYQGVKVAVMADGSAVEESHVPIISGKDAMFRFYVKQQSAWQPREVFARVDVTMPDGGTYVAKESFHVDFDSNADKLASTLNVFVSGENIKSGAQYVFSLQEVDEPDNTGEENNTSNVFYGDSKHAIWPPSETVSFDCKDVGADLEIVIVPIHYTAGGVDYYPDLSDSQLKLYADLFYSTYPVSDVNITIGEDMEWSSTIGSVEQNKWSDLLNAVTQKRSKDGAAFNKYYYGLFNPAVSISEFCKQGCIAGLSWQVTSASMADQRVSIGLGFKGTIAAYTMIHETGHAHGRSHSPGGGAGNLDPDYPYPTGQIGVQGYDFAKKQLLSPTLYYDFMSYEKNIWVSDYTYDAISDRVAEVNSSMFSINSTPPPDGTWITVLKYENGKVAKGPVFDRLSVYPSGEEFDVNLFDENEKLIKTVSGYFTGYVHSSGGLYFISNPSSDVSYVQVSGLERIKL